MTDRRPTVHHAQVAIPAGGEDRARAFYAGLLGFDELAKPANLASRGGCWFQTGNLQIHLGIDKDFSPATKAHIAYQVDDFGAIRDRFHSAGIAIVEDEPLPGYERFYVADPFGNRVEILAPTARG